MAELIVLGAGVPKPSPERFGTSLVLTLDGQNLMFDCGPATTHKLVKGGLWPTAVDYLFFTHHHSDHNADYPCFVLCRWDQSIGKENSLQVYGPPPTEAITEKLFGAEGAFSADLAARINGPVSQKVHRNRGGSLPRPGLRMTVKDIAAGEVIEGKTWRITTARAHHLEPWLESLAYRVETAEGTIVLLGDTGPCAELTELARGADVLVANCWDHQETMTQNGEAPGQTGTADAANFAAEAGADTLILTHMGAAISTPGSLEKAVADISRTYGGRIIASRELMRIPLFG